MSVPNPYTIILIIDDNSPFILPLVRCFAKQKRTIIHILVINNDKYCSCKFSKYISSVNQYSKFTNSDFLGLIQKHVFKTNANVLIPVREWITDLVIQNKLEIKKLVNIQLTPKLETLDLVRNKSKLNEWLQLNHFPNPQTQLLDSSAKKSILSKKHNYPFLLKPCYGIGGKGIVCINNLSELQSALKNNKILVEKYIMQDYIQGYDIDISAFCINGIIEAYTIQKGIIARTLSYAKGIEFIKNQDFLSEAKKIFKKLKYSGIAHLDFRYDQHDKTYKLIDFNARYWSTLLASSSVGVNFPVLVVLNSLNLECTKYDYRTGRYYLGSTAIKNNLKKIFKKQRLIKFRDTQLKYVIMDPVPEAINFFINIFYRLKKVFFNKA